MPQCRCGNECDGSLKVQYLWVSETQGLTHEEYFMCDACYKEYQEEQAFERELMQDPEYAAEAKKTDEEHRKWFQDQLKKHHSIN